MIPSVRLAMTVCLLFLGIASFGTGYAGVDNGVGGVDVVDASALRFAVNITAAGDSEEVQPPGDDPHFRYTVYEAGTLPVEATVVLHSNLGDDADGVQGWSLSVETDPDFNISSATTGSTAMREFFTDGFDFTEVVDPALNDGRHGAVSAIVLCTGCTTTLPPLSSISTLSLGGSIDTSALETGDVTKPVAVQVISQDGNPLRGAGHDVPTVATVNTQSHPVAVSGARVSAEYGAVTEGSQVTIRGTGFGGDTPALCVQMFDPNGETAAFLRPVDVEGDELTAEVTTIVPGASSARVAVMTGSFDYVVPPDLPPGVSVPEPGAWLFVPEPVQEILLEPTPDFELDTRTLPGFRRADANADGTVDISDPLFTLNFLFVGGPEPPCKDAADSNDQGVLDISSPIYTLNFLFGGGPFPPAPFLECGIDPTNDQLTCADYPPTCPAVDLPGNCRHHFGNLVNGSVRLTLPSGPSFTSSSFTLQMHAADNSGDVSFDVTLPVELSGTLSRREIAVLLCRMLRSMIRIDPRVADLDCEVLEASTGEVTMILSPPFPGNFSVGAIVISHCRDG